ncbi:unnamed protein product [marine sediment metagenome]|uniref:Uncharacterized protein n=1 Tax=marine sediment metagenome TaxID=412755 RepID=X1CPU0_9ZZZZ
MQMTNKKQQIKQLARKYFVEQKAKEVFLYSIFAAAFVFIPYWVGLLVEKWFGYISKFFDDFF